MKFTPQNLSFVGLIGVLGSGKSAFARLPSSMASLRIERAPLKLHAR